MEILSNKIQKHNAKTLIIFIYLKYILSVISLFKFMIYIDVICVVATFILLVNSLIINKNKIEKRFIYTILFVTLLYFINMIFVSYKQDVLVWLFDFLGYNLLIAYVIFEGIDYEYILRFWYKLAKILTVTTFILYFLGLTTSVGYMFIGIYNAYNSLIISYHLFNEKQNTLKNWIYIILVIFLAFLGNRGALLTVAMAIIITFLFSIKKWTLNNVLIHFMIILSIFFATIFLDEILELTIKLFDIIKLNSYSIRKIKIMLQGEFWSMSSGRDVLYNIALDIIKNSHGLPRGVGYFNVITNGEFGYPHNFVLELLLVFGWFLGSIILVYFVYSTIKFYKKQLKVNYSVAIFFALIFIFFITRTMFSSTFLKERSFWIITIMILNRKEKYSKG